MKDTRFTNEINDKLTNNELVDNIISENADEITETTRIFKTRLNHLIFLIVLGIVGVMFGYGIFTLVAFIPALIMAIFVNKANNNKVTALMMLSGNIGFMKSIGVLDDSNMYILEKYLNRLNLEETK